MSKVRRRRHWDRSADVLRMSSGESTKEDGNLAISSTTMSSSSVERMERSRARSRARSLLLVEVEVDGVDGTLHLDEEVIGVVRDVGALALGAEIKVGADDALEADALDRGRAVVAHGRMDLRSGGVLGDNGFGSLHSDLDAWREILGASALTLHAGRNEGHEERESSLKGESRCSGSRGRRRRGGRERRRRGLRALQRRGKLVDFVLVFLEIGGKAVEEGVEMVDGRGGEEAREDGADLREGLFSNGPGLLGINVHLFQDVLEELWDLQTL